MNVSDEELFEKWLAALRSGEYEQGEAYLRPNERFYCCLGVLCDVTDREAWTFTEYGDYYWGEETSESTPPAWLSAELGIEEYVTLLTYLNDHGGFTFVEIAEVLEKARTLDQRDEDHLLRIAGDLSTGQATSDAVLSFFGMRGFNQSSPAP